MKSNKSLMGISVSLMESMEVINGAMKPINPSFL
jgi:hypothetical protein